MSFMQPKYCMSEYWQAAGQAETHTHEAAAADLKEFHSASVFVGTNLVRPSFGVTTFLQSPHTEVASTFVVVFGPNCQPSDTVLIAKETPKKDTARSAGRTNFRYLSNIIVNGLGKGRRRYFPDIFRESSSIFFCCSEITFDCPSAMAFSSFTDSMRGATRFPYSTDFIPVFSSVRTISGNWASTSCAMTPISLRQSDFHLKEYPFNFEIFSRESPSQTTSSLNLRSEL